MSYQFAIELPVRWKDIDNAGVLNNAVYLTLLEEARFAYFRELDLVREDGNFPFLVGETSIRFLKPGAAGMTLRVRAGVQRLGNKSFDMAYEVCHGDDVLATAAATLVWIDDSLQSMEIPDTARQKIAGLEGIPSR